jgi:hypothetical protein
MVEEDDDVLELTQMVEDEPDDRPDFGQPDPWSEESSFPEPSPPPPPPPPRWDEPEPEPMPQPRPAARRPTPVFDDFEDDEPPPPPRPRRRAVNPDDGLISRRTAEDASHHLTHLARELGDDLSIGPMPIGIRTVEEVVRELLKPLLKEWLDENLPTVVERLVQQEIDRMIRRSQKF